MGWNGINHELFILVVPQPNLLSNIFNERGTCNNMYVDYSLTYACSPPAPVQPNLFSF